MRLSNASLNIDNDDPVKTLGILWHPASDVFYFKITPLSFKGTSTKRTLLSTIAKTFDPLGWLCPPSQSSIKQSCKDCENNRCSGTKGFLQTLHLIGNNLLRMCN
ncbi:hypothetical protein TNCV_4747851 [Trichonephila clavipes]|nr:hypothetical protein TNCV_4747851 [Trichonephila clavipes]